MRAGLAGGLLAFATDRKHHRHLVASAYMCVSNASAWLRPTTSGRLARPFANKHVEPGTMSTMMSGDECRAKSRRAREVALAAPDSTIRATWTEVAVEWLKLGRLADDYAELEAELLARDPG